MRPLGTRDEERRKAVEEAQEAAQSAARRRGDDLRAVMSTVAGRRFVWRLLNEVGTFSSVFSASPTVHAHAEGKRAVGVALAAEAQVEARDFYVAMVEEAVEALPPALAPTVRESLPD